MVVPERGQPVLAADDLRGVIAAKQGVRVVVDVTCRHRHAEDWLRDDASVKERPDEVVLPVRHTLLRSEAQDAVDIRTQAFAGVQCKEREVRTLIVGLEFIRRIEEIFLLILGVLAVLLVGDAADERPIEQLLTASRISVEPL